MSLMLVADEAAVDLAMAVRDRIAAGAPVWEAPVDQMPNWFADHVAGASVQHLFQSEHATLAILSDGRKVLRRAPRI